MTEHDLKEVQRLYEFYRGARESDGRNGVHRAMDFVEGFVAGEKASEHRREEMQLKVLELEAKQASSGKQSQGGKTMLTLLEMERARSAKLVEAATRALRFGFVMTEKDGELINVASELRKALSAYEASRG